MIFDITINDLLYSNPPVPELHSSGALFGRQVGSFTSVVRLYLDTIKTHAREITGGKLDEAEVQAVLSERYDRSFYYRAMVAIRNHAQHRAFPVHSASYGGSWNADRTENTYRADFFFDVKKIKHDSKFKAATAEEIEAVGGKIDLEACVRHYFADLCDIHAELRKLFAPSKVDAEANITFWRDRWRKESGSAALTGVGAFKFNAEGLDGDADRAYIDPQVDEYRLSLEAKTAGLTNMAKRKIGLYRESEGK